MADHPPVGTIVRVLTINGYSEGWGLPAYGLVIPSCEGDDRLAVCVPTARTPTRSSGEGWHLGSNEYERVRQSDVPDEFWAALAKYQLLKGGAHT